MQALTKPASYYESKFFIWRQRIGYGISDYACNLSFLVANTYLVFYYTNCAGIDAGAIGIMMVATRFVDAFTDYMVGIFIDRTDTKWGRYRPWMLFGTPVLAVGMVTIFMVPVEWAEGPKLAWAFISYFVMSFGYTMVNIPLTPIVAALSPDPVERTKISTSRTVFSSLGSLSASLFTLPMIWFFSGASDATSFSAVEPAVMAVGYRNTNLILAIAVVVIMIIVFFNVVEINPPTVLEEKTNLIRDLGRIFRNKYYCLIIGQTLLLFLGYFCMFNAMQYYYTYVIADPGAQPIGSTLMTVCMLPMMFLCSWLNTRGVSKRNIFIIGTIIDIIAYGIVWFIPIPIMGTFGLALIGLGFGLRTPMYWAMMPDIYDYTEWQFGKNMGGTQNALTAFANKVSSALSGAFVSFMLLNVGYEANLGSLNELAAAGTPIGGMFPDISNGLNFLFAGVCFITCIGGLLLLLPYDLDKKNPQIRADLDARMAEKIAKEKAAGNVAAVKQDEIILDIGEKAKEHEYEEVDRRENRGWDADQSVHHTGKELDEEIAETERTRDQQKKKK